MASWGWGVGAMLSLALMACGGEEAPPPKTAVKKKPPAAQRCTIKKLAQKQANPGPIVADDTGVYWLNRGTSSGDGQLQVLKTGSKEVKTLADTLERPRDLAIDGDSVYYTTKAGVFRVGKEGGDTPQQLAKVSVETKSLALSELSVYWAQVDKDGDTLAKVSKQGGVVKVVAKGLSPVFAIAMNEDKLYWSSRGGNASIMRVIADGGKPEQVGLPIDAPGTLMVDDTDVLFDSAKGVFKMPKTGGEPTKVNGTPVASPAFGGHRLTMSNGEVFGATDDGIWKKDTKITQLLDQEGVVALAVDAKYLYFSSQEGELVGAIPRSCKPAVQ